MSTTFHQLDGVFTTDNTSPTLSFDIAAILKQHEELVVIQVLTQLLKRKPTIEDAKRCTKLHQEGVNGCWLAFDGVTLGKIDFNFPCATFASNGYEPPTASVKFTPQKQFASYAPNKSTSTNSNCNP